MSNASNQDLGQSVEPTENIQARPISPVSRRSFMKGTVGAALATTTATCTPETDQADGKLPPTSSAPNAGQVTWTNWSGSVTSHPRSIERPKTEAELIDLIGIANKGGLPVRIVGTGHSFVPLCASDGLIISLEDLTGIVAADLEKRQATIWGGTKIHQMHEPLRAAGLAMENMGDIDRQAIAGAVATGTHGTGHGIRSISNQVIAIRMVTAAGKVVECSAAKDPELFKAAQVSLGALGVMTQVTLRLLPTYRLHEKVWRIPFDECFSNLAEFIANNRHFEFFWVSQTDSCLVKTLNPTDRPPDELPDLEGERIGHSDVIFPSVRSRKFNEIEFSLPEENGPPCLRELRQLMLQKHPKVTMPLEYRTVGADDPFLSPAYGRDTVSISAHELAVLPCESFFADVEAIFRKHDGRPHWAKMHTHTPDDFKKLYPKWDAFHAVRRRIDPEGRFMNDHLHAILS
jgi:FAD/FMN-containing dehydrogenase